MLVPSTDVEDDEEEDERRGWGRLPSEPEA